MKATYPIIITRDADYFVAFFPDFNSGTQAKTLTDVISMSREAMGLLGVTLEDRGLKLPEPSSIDSVTRQTESDIITLVDVDFLEYRKANDSRTVRKNCTLPAWLNNAAERAGLNYSNLLQNAIKNALGLHSQS